MTTITRSNSGLGIVLDAGRTFFYQTSHRMRDALQRRKVYRDAFFELASLSDRELGDLGIPRSGIKRLALETAYDL